MNLTTDQIEKIIHQRVHSKRDREVLTLLYIDGLTREQAAEQVDCCARTIYNIQRRHKHLFADICQ